MPHLDVSGVGDQGAIAIEFAPIEHEPVAGFAGDDGVDACIGRDHIGVATIATVQGVVVLAPSEGVVADATGQRIRAA